MSTHLTGRFFTTASGRASYEISEARPEFLAKILVVVRSQFGFDPIREAVIGLDQVYIDVSNGSTTLVLGWDNWSGCFVHAQQPAGDEVIAEIGRYINARLDALQSPDAT